MQATVLSNGGKAGGSVDRESETVDGKVLYEASVTGADGAVKDLDITEDGKSVETKTDDAADAAQEHADRAAAVLKGPPSPIPPRSSMHSCLCQT